VPFTLWPLDIAGLARQVVESVRNGQPLDEGMLFVLEQIRGLPPEAAQEAVSEYEKLVEQGNYEPLIRASEKYAIREKELLEDEEFQRQWSELKRLFSVDQFRDRKGIVRRRLVQERNIHPDWEFKWNTAPERFQVAFDGFCHRWNLYGMEHEKPLLLKLTVNPTPHGLLIMIPTYWSFDPKRDLDWIAINRLHKARGVLRQGSKMSEGRLERHAQAKKAYQASLEAQKLKLRGAERLKFIAGRCGLLLETDPRVIRRLIRKGSSCFGSTYG
jgi:hypothetical protein